MNSVLTILRRGPVLRAVQHTGTYRPTSDFVHYCKNVPGRRVSFFSNYPAHEVVGMPSLSPTMEVGSIAGWAKEEGDFFGAGDVLCSVETDKATVDFEAQDDGYIAKILVQAGPTEINCGDPILITVEDEGSVGAFKEYELVSAPTVPEPPTNHEDPTQTKIAEASTSTSKESPGPSMHASVSPNGMKTFASPLAKMLAKEMGYKIETIEGSGPGGRILAADVKEFVTPSLSQPTSADTEELPAAGLPNVQDGYTEFPIPQSYRDIASRLTHSKLTVPHYYLTVDIAMDAIMELRNELSLDSSEGSKTVGVYEFVIKAAAKAMKDVPSANASWMDSVVRVYDSVDINVVVGSGDGLHAPVIRDCGNKGLGAISMDLNAALHHFPHEDDAEPAEYVGTVSILNLGMYGVKSCAPIIREPQAVALAVGAVENRIVPDSQPDEALPYKECAMMTATLSCDHRVVDGAVGAQWLSCFKAYLERPSTLLL